MRGGVSGGFNVGTVLEYQRGILLMEDCEGADSWVGSGTGADFVVDLNAGGAWSGSKGLRLKTRATNPADGDTVTAYRYLQLPLNDLVVVRMRVQTLVLTTIEWFHVKLILHDGTREYQAGIQVGVATPILKYLNSAGSWVEVTGYGKAGRAYSWDMLEFQLDYDSNEYLKVLYHGVESSLADLAFQDVGAGVTRYAMLELKVEAAGAALAGVYWDSIYVGEFEKF